MIHRGKVKFYSTEKGFGFIFNETENEDVFFHITEVKGPDAPNAGDFVSFEVSESEDQAQKKALNVKISMNSVARDKSNNLENGIDGFPCIRGESIKGFIVAKRLGKVTVGRPVLRWFRAFDSANGARDALICKAKIMGANAIFNYIWHNDRRRQERVFSKKNYLEDNFWAEGEAVILERHIDR